MFASAGRSRYDYLAPLAGLCLQYVDPRHDIEANRDQLNTIWKDPDKFVPFGNTFLTTITEKEKITIITSTFLDLAMLCPQKCSYDPRHQPLEKRWLMLRAFIFHYWLNQAKNQNIRIKVIHNVSKSRRTTEDQLLKSNGPSPTISTINPPTIPVLVSTKNKCFDVQVSTTSVAKTTNDKEPEGNGLESLLASRTFDRNEETLFEIPPQQPPLKSAEQPILLSSFQDLSLIHPQTIHNTVSSYLLVHTEDGVDVVSKLSPLEVYSADNLYLRRHGRFSGNNVFYPSNNIGDIMLSVGTDTKCFIDRHSRYFHIARESSSYFMQHGTR
jgi:hypothetical protein